jgi:hypothetical protein
MTTNEFEVICQKLDEQTEILKEISSRLVGVEEIAPVPVPEEERVLPEGKRVIRTKSTGDRVYLLDDVEKTKAWVTSPEILAKLGFEASDVEEVEDTSLLGYHMTASIYKVD